MTPLPSPAPSPAPLREPHLLRFRLRQLLALVTLLSLLCGLIVLTEGPWPLVIGGATLLIAAHVFGTLIGTRLRDTSRDVLQWRAANSGLDDDPPRVSLQPDAELKSAMPPTTPLADHGRVGNWLIVFVLAGGVLGSAVGGTIIAFSIGPRIGWAGWIVGTISCGVLGTWAAFLVSSFGSIARHAWRHAEEAGK